LPETVFRGGQVSFGVVIAEPKIVVVVESFDEIAVVVKEILILCLTPVAKYGIC
jgi:hypothetical protein